MPNMPDITQSEWLLEFVQSIEITGQFLMGAAIAAIVLGLLQCFFGYPLFRIILGVFAFIGAGATSYSMAYAMFGGDIPASVITGLTTGAICALVVVQLYYLGVFLLGSALGTFLAITAINVFEITVQVPLIMVLSGLVAGLIALVIQKLLVIIATSLFGAISTVAGIAQLAGYGIDPDPEKQEESLQRLINIREADTRTIIMLVAVFILAVAGIIVQYKITGRRRKGEPVKVSRVVPADTFEEQ